MSQSQYNPYGQFMDQDRLEQQIQFILEIDKLKGIVRRSYLLDQERQENAAEHSWHLAVIAMLLGEHTEEPVAVSRVVEMLLVHDLVEIDAGDAYIYDAEALRDQAAREAEAARRIFGLLPADQADMMWGLWTEFEAGVTPEARFAKALDRLMPLLHNYYTEGRSWREHGITSAQVLARNASVKTVSGPLWRLICRLVEEAVARGYLAA